MNIVRTAAFAKIVTGLSAIWTFLLSVSILCWQVTSWILTGEWIPFPISIALALAGIEHAEIYETAGIIEHSSYRSLESPGLFDWFLDLPTSALLLAVAAILLLFSISAASIQKQHAPTEEQKGAAL